MRCNLSFDGRWRRVSCRKNFGRIVNAFQHVIEHWLRESRVNADPQQLVHHQITVRQRADGAVLYVFVSGLPRQVTAEEQTRGDLSVFQKPYKFVARKRRIRTYEQRKSEPTGIGIRSGFRKTKELLHISEAGL